MRSSAYQIIVQTLAKSGGIHSITQRQIGIMIGEVFAIQHEVNLHTEILDTPDLFWNEDVQCE